MYEKDNFVVETPDVDSDGKEITVERVEQQYYDWDDLDELGELTDLYVEEIDGGDFPNYPVDFVVGPDLEKVDGE